MTISSQLDSAGPFTLNGVTVDFPWVNWKLLRSTDLTVTKIDVAGVETTLALTTDYTLTFDPTITGGTVTITNAYKVANPTGQIYMLRTPLADQQLDLVNQGAYNAEDVEVGFDLITTVAIYLKRLIAATMRLGTLDVDGSGSFRARGNRIGGLGAAVNNDDAVTLAQAQAIGSVSGNVPSPTGGQLNFWLRATGTGTFGWVNLTLALISGVSANGASLVATTYAGMKTLLGLDNVNNTSDVNKPVSTATSAAIAAAIAALPASTFSGYGIIYGCQLANNSTDAANDIDVTAGFVAENTAGILMQLAALTKQLDVAWAVGNNQGMLDTGAVNNVGAVTYHIFAIRRTDTGVVDILASLSPTAPTMPASYTQKRRIGSIVRVTGVIKPFNQYGDHFYWKTPAVETNFVVVPVTTQQRQLTVPLGLPELIAIVSNRVEGVANNRSRYTVRGPNEVDGNITLADGFGVYAAVGSPSAFAAGDPPGEMIYRHHIAVGATGQVWEKAQLASSVVSTLNTIGWIDNRGRFSAP